MDHKDEIRKVTSELEQNNTANLPGLLQGKFEEPRIATLKEIVQQNETDRKANPNTASLDLEVRTGFAGYNDITLTRSTGSLGEVLGGGSTLYSDQLNLLGLHHTAGNEDSPSNRKDIDVRKLTTELENGHGKGTADLLSGLYEEERVRIFKGVRDLNAKDRAEGKTNATLNVYISPNKIGLDTISVDRELPGIHDAFLGGTQLYSDVLDVRTNERTTYENNDKRK